MLLKLDMYSRFALKFKDFNGKLAIPVTFSEGGLDLISKTSEVGYVMFHTAHAGQHHLFAVKGAIRLITPDAFVEDDTRYKIPVGTPAMLALVEIDIDHEIPSSQLSYQSFAAGATLDARFSPIQNLFVK